MKPSLATKFLFYYSAVVTAAFVFTVWHGVKMHATQTTGPDSHAHFDQLTVHRINVVEPDGTLRMVISDRARFPGEFSHGTERLRPDREDSAGVIFLNDEGTENGGLLFSGYRSKDGVLHSAGHLSFDEYESDQTISLDAQQQNGERFSRISLNDMPVRGYTPAETAARAQLQLMKAGPAKDEALRAFRIAHSDAGQKPRIQLVRSHQGAAALRISDAVGNDRIQIGVDANGDPSMVFLDPMGRVTKRVP
jgi:hypothetical protein